MGDGGVACLASHHIIDHFSICGGNTNGSIRTSSGTLSSTRKIGKMNGSNMKKLKRGEKTEELGLKSSVDTVKEALVNSSSNNTNVDVNKDEVEEGELGTFPIENGEFIVERPNTTARKYGLKSEIEKGEVVGEKWRRSSGKVEKGEPFSYGKWRKPDEVEKNGFSSRSWRVSSKEEPEKGEYVQEWRRKSGVVKDDYGYSSARGHDSSKDNRWKGDGEWTQPLSRPSLSFSGKCSSIKGLSRCGNRLKKRFSRYEPDTLEKTHRINSKIVDEVQCELGNGKNHSREYTSVNRLKRQGADADASEWRPRGVSDGYMSSKSRKVSDNGFHTPHSSERYVSRSTERSYRNPSFLSKYVSSDRYSSKHFKPSYDKYHGSPLHSERSPHNRAGHLDHCDESPERYEPSLYDQNSRYDHSKSPNERNQGYGYSKSPHDCSPLPSDRSPIFDYRKRSRSCSGLPPHDQSQYLDRMVQAPISLEQSPAHLKLQETNRKIGFSENKQISGGNRGPEEKSKQKKDPGEGKLRASAKESEYQSKLHEDISYRIESVVVILKEEEILPVPDANANANANDQTHDQSRYLDRMVQTPISLQQSSAHLKLQETNRKIGFSENKQISGGNRGPEEKSKQKKDPGEGKLRASAKESEYQSKLHEDISSRIESVVVILKEEEILPDPDANANDQTQEAPWDSGSTEEMASMEEDMDICNTPPQEPVLSDAIPAKWFYIDHIGEEQGPFRLSDLKKLVEQGFLTSDHLIQHSDCERWVTVENAVSPLVTTSFQPIISDAVTQIVSPPDAPGNLLADGGEVTDCPTPFSSDCTSYIEGCLVASETLKDLQIDERVGALLEGFNFVPGRELEVVGEALQITFVDMEWERLELTEGIPGQQPLVADIHDQISFEAATDSMSRGTMEVKSTILTPSEKDISLNTDNDEWFSGLWWSKGGDWKRNDEAVLDRHWKQKAVLNDGYPLCQMQKCGNEDPRWRQEDELYYPSLGQKFDLPSWAFTSPDEWNDSSSAYRSTLSKFNNVRGALGMMLPVVSINACVVKDHESFVSDPRVKARGKDIYSSRRYSVSSDTKRSPEEVCSHPQSISEQDSHGSSKSLICKSVSVSKDCVCTVDELKLYLGDWYYFDGAGNERGPSSFSEFQVLAQQGVIPMNSSIFRKVDKIWVPIFSDVEVPISGLIMQQVKNDSSDSGRSPVGVHKDTLDRKSRVSGAFHSLHPQFISYTIVKLHELVMKSYKSREFAAAINEVLDPWINARLSKKEMEKNMYSSALIQKSDQFRASKRFRVDENEEYETDELSGSAKGDYSFDELCSDAIFSKEHGVASNVEGGTWGQLDGCVLARVFHFLRADIRSLVNSGYDTEKIFCLVLRGCTSITSSMLEKILKSFLNLSFVDIRGCNQFEELTCSFPNINWIRDRGTESKFRSAKHLSDKQLDDSSGLRDYLENSDRRDSAKRFFRQSLYKRTKLFDARKSSSILSREANLSRFNVRKSNVAFKHMKDFLDLSLKDIMKENTYEFLVPKVAQIEGRMRSGYYAGRGLRAVKEDIIRICRDAIKAKNRSDVTGINRIVTLFIRLATRVEDRLNSSCDRDEFLKTWKDDTPPGFSSSSSSKHKKNYKETAKKSLIRSKRSSSINIFSDLDDYASDHEIKRCLSKLNKKLDSGSEMSDNLDRSSDEGLTDGESTDSNAASDSDLHSEVGIKESRVEGYSPPIDAFDSLTEREWGARMTKASLVPPVTRKYEVIDHYVVVADEEEVRRKMQASLPEDYAEKLHAQRSGIDESDMQIPEVKDYKPRKQLGVEVIEQEVYGIDPYTHNLLLDSMPDESDWSPLDKHLFIEDMLLRTLNKQVRHLTGSGNMSMTYPLRPAFKEILEIAEENNDLRTAKLSDYVLKAIDSRPEDNYVSYRKGLGVVCNKEGGFNEDDFVVDFLGEVYPAWRWFEKQDGIRSLQKNSEDPAPEFYNIYLERPKGDADGYDLVVVDAMHKANYASRICHSCRPNCEAKVTAVDGQYQIGIYSVSPIQYGEEITFDYNSVTESKEEYEASVCLCGSHVCRGSFLNLTGEGAFLKVLNEYHGILDRHQLLLEACELNSVSEEDSIDLLKAGLGSCLLDGLPDWLIAYSARLVRFINFERTKLPKEILRHNLEEKKKYFIDISLEAEKNDAEVQAEGVYNQRLQNLALTLDKVRYVMRCIFGEAKNAPPPLDRLCPQEAASHIWNGEGSLVDELIQCVAPYIEDTMLSELQAKIHAHNPSSADNVEMELQKSLIWLRDELRNLPCTYKCRHDAAADLIHTYAHTQSFFRIKEYKPVTSPPVYISSLDLGPKHADKLGSDGHEYCKTYGENYCLGQLIYWYTQANAEPDGILARASRGCLSLPDIGSFYAQVQKPSSQRVYGPRTVKFMLSRMEKQPQRPWPKDRIWAFKTRPKIVGSPMLDAVLNKAPLGKDMLHWLKHRLPIIQAKLDR